jgi:hypothetical protein
VLVAEGTQKREKKGKKKKNNKTASRGRKNATMRVNTPMNEILTLLFLPNF